MTTDGYFYGASGTRYTYADIADRIRKEASQTLGKHIFVQLEAIGLLHELTNGTTPCGLPFTFAKAPIFDVQHLPHCPDRILVVVDNRFLVALIRPQDGLKVDIYPITNGQSWIDPSDRFEVDEGEVRERELEQADD